MIFKRWHISFYPVLSSMVFTLTAFMGTAGYVLAETAEAVDPEIALKTCLASQPDVVKPDEKKDGPAKYMLKGLGKELKSNAKGMAEGMVFVFSAQDIDPYEKHAPTDKPYTDLTVALVDGSTCSLIKYPDNSGKIVGGFADGTIIAPLTGNTFVVGYPNGARGRLEKLPGGGCKIYRPDNTVTTMKKNMAGRFSIRNSQLGYLGEAMPDRTGLQYEFQN